MSLLTLTVSAGEIHIPGPPPPPPDPTSVPNSAVSGTNEPNTLPPTDYVTDAAVNLLQELLLVF